MNAGATTERVLIALRQLLASREFKPGARLDPAMLAQQIGASATPLREALHRLTGEGLVENRAGGGFNLPFLDASSLKSSYEWSEQLLNLAIRHWPRRRGVVLPPPPSAEIASTAERTAALFLHIGRQSSNREHGWAITRLNARLHHVRLTEERVIERLEEDLLELTDVIHSQNRHLILQSISNYHKIRQKLCTYIIKESHNAP